MFSHELSFWTLTVVVVLSFESPGLQRNSFPSTLLQFIIYFLRLLFWNENMLLVSMGFIWVIFLIFCLWNAVFYDGVSFCFWLLCCFLPYIKEKKCNNELGLSHQDGENIFSHKTIVGDRGHPTWIEIFSYTSFYPYNTKLWMRSETFYRSLHSTLSGRAQAV